MRGNPIWRRRNRRAEPVDIIPVMTGSKPWWQSKTIQSAAVGLLNVAFAVLGLDASGEETKAIVVGIVGVIGTVGIILGRKNAKTTLTK
jgi:hypothetical protein